MFKDVSRISLFAMALLLTATPSFCCFPTSQRNIPITTTALGPEQTTNTTTTTTAAATSSNCCDDLWKNETPLSFGQGVFSFTYNNDTCRTSATVICS